MDATGSVDPFPFGDGFRPIPSTDIFKLAGVGNVKLAVKSTCHVRNERLQLASLLGRSSQDFFVQKVLHKFKSPSPEISGHHPGTQRRAVNHNING